MPNETTPVNYIPARELQAAIHESERELAVRKRCYPDWIKIGKLTEFEAEERFNRLSLAVRALHHYQELSAEAARNRLDSVPALAAV